MSTHLFGQEPPYPDESELVDGPVPPPEGAEVIRPPLFAREQPTEPVASPEAVAAPSGPDGYTVLRATWDVLSARLVALIAVLGALVVWGIAVWSPDPWRLAAGAGVSIGVVIPSIVLFLRKG
jgi:hypothetical protein